MFGQSAYWFQQFAPSLIGGIRLSWARWWASRAGARSVGSADANLARRRSVIRRLGGQAAAQQRVVTGDLAFDELKCRFELLQVVLDPGPVLLEELQPFLRGRIALLHEHRVAMQLLD